MRPCGRVCPIHLHCPCSSLLMICARPSDVRLFSPRIVRSLGNPLEDPDAQCQNITADEPVEKECCGFCILNNAHLMKMWNCTGLRDLVGNTLGIDALARSVVSSFLLGVLSRWRTIL